MAKDGQYSALTLPLVTEKWQRDALATKMDCVRRAYNNMLDSRLKCYREMIKTKEWRQLDDVIRDELQQASKAGRKQKSERLKEAYARKDEILRANGFSEFSFISEVITFTKYYQKHISSSMAAIGIAKPMWRAFQSLLFGNGKQLAFKAPGTVNRLVSDGTAGIRLINEDGRYFVVLSNQKAKARVIKLAVKGPQTEYDRKMLAAPIKTVSVLRKIEKGKEKYYCQMLVARSPYIKLNNDGRELHPVGKGRVGIAIWRGTLCAVSSTKVLITDLSPNAKEFTKEKEELSRRTEDLRRKANPGNFNEDGTIKSGIVGEDGKRRKLVWKDTYAYRKAKADLRELYRRHNVDKELIRNKTIYDLLAMGDEFVFSDVSFNPLKPEWNENEPLTAEDYAKKKARRMSIQENAPASFLEKLDQKLTGRGLIPVVRNKVPESLFWYRHDKDVSDKELFAGEYVFVDGKIIPQTLYRAFLIRRYDAAGGRYDQKALTNDWENIITNIE